MDGSLMDNENEGLKDKLSGALPPINDQDFNRLVTFVQNNMVLICAKSGN